MSNPFDPSGGMGGMGGLGAMLGGFQQRVQELKEKQAQTHYEGEAGGGLVKVVVTGEQEVVSVSIADDAMGDRELLEDLVRAATSESIRKAKEGLMQEMSALTGGMLPPGMIPGL